VLRLIFTSLSVSDEAKITGQTAGLRSICFLHFYGLSVENRERMAFSVGRRGVSEVYHDSGARLFSFFSR
jgi:hypothetical protein